MLHRCTKKFEACKLLAVIHISVTHEVLTICEFVKVPLVRLQCVILVFSDHTRLL